MVSTSHSRAQFYLNRDIECVKTFFKRRYNFEADININLDNVTKIKDLDKEVKASGFLTKELKGDIHHLEMMEGYTQWQKGDDDFEEK